MSKILNGAPPGRPHLYDSKMKRYSISLPMPLVRVAGELGEGNYSVGVRKALEWFKDHPTGHPGPPDQSGG